jgi:hypothetical protein
VAGIDETDEKGRGGSGWELRKGWSVVSFQLCPPTADGQCSVFSVQFSVVGGPPAGVWHLIMPVFKKRIKIKRPRRMLHFVGICDPIGVTCLYLQTGTHSMRSSCMKRGNNHENIFKETFISYWLYDKPTRQSTLHSSYFCRIAMKN